MEIFKNNRETKGKHVFGTPEISPTLQKTKENKGFLAGPPPIFMPFLGPPCENLKKIRGSWELTKYSKEI